MTVLTRARLACRANRKEDTKTLLALIGNAPNREHQKFLEPFLLQDSVSILGIAFWTFGLNHSGKNSI